MDRKSGIVDVGVCWVRWWDEATPGAADDSGIEEVDGQGDGDCLVSSVELKSGPTFSAGADDSGLDAGALGGDGAGGVGTGFVSAGDSVIFCCYTQRFSGGGWNGIIEGNLYVRGNGSRTAQGQGVG